MSERVRIGTTDDGTFTPVYFDGRYFSYGCGMVPLEEADTDA